MSEVACPMCKGTGKVKEKKEVTVRCAKCGYEGPPRDCWLSCSLEELKDD